MRYLFFSGVGIFLLAGALLSDHFLSSGRLAGMDQAFFVPVVFAEDDDDEEDEDDDDDDDDEDDDDSSAAKSSSETKTVTKQVTVYETRIVNDPPFLRDTDRDGLVDGIDPEPDFDFREYFTDTDGDSVPNAYDKHHDEDDFSYHDEADINENGIIDSYE